MWSNVKCTFFSRVRQFLEGPSSWHPSLNLWVSRQVVPAGPPAHQGRQGQQVEVVGGPWWPFLYSRWENLPWGFFWGPSSSLEALCSKYSVVSRWQQVVVFSVVFECCMIIHELCTDVETVSGRTWPCIIRTWTVLVVWRSYETVLVVWRSYKTVCTLVWIVRWSCDIRVLIRVLDVGLGNGFTRFHTIYIRYWHGWAHSWSGLHVRLYIRSRTVSHGLVRSLIRSYTDMAPVPVF